MAQSLDPQILTLASNDAGPQKAIKNQTPGEKSAEGDSFARVYDQQRDRDASRAQGSGKTTPAEAAGGKTLPAQRDESVAEEAVAGTDKDQGAARTGAGQSDAARQISSAETPGSGDRMLPSAEAVDEGFPAAPGGAATAPLNAAADTLKTDAATAAEEPVHRKTDAAIAQRSMQNTDRLFSEVRAHPARAEGAAAGAVVGQTPTATPGDAAAVGKAIENNAAAGDQARTTALAASAGTPAASAPLSSGAGLSPHTAGTAGSTPASATVMPGVPGNAEIAGVTATGADPATTRDGAVRRSLPSGIAADRASGSGAREAALNLAATTDAPGTARLDWIRAQGTGDMSTAGPVPETLDLSRVASTTRVEATPLQAAQPGIAGVAATPATASTGAAASTATNPMPEYTLEHAPEDPEFSREVAARMKLLLRDGVREARLQLHPAELGRLQVSVSTDGDQARVAFFTETAAAREAIELSMPRLREMLEQNGLQLAQSDVEQRDLGQRGDDATGRQGAEPVEVAGDGGEVHAEQLLATTLRSAGIDTYI